MRVRPMVLIIAVFMLGSADVEIGSRLAQSDATTARFEVASIRPAKLPACLPNSTGAPHCHDRSSELFYRQSLWCPDLADGRCAELGQ